MTSVRSPRRAGFAGPEQEGDDDDPSAKTGQRLHRPPRLEGARRPEVRWPRRCWSPTPPGFGPVCRCSTRCPTEAGARQLPRGVLEDAGSNVRRRPAAPAVRERETLRAKRHPHPASHLNEARRCRDASSPMPQAIRRRPLPGDLPRASWSPITRPRRANWFREIPVGFHLQIVLSHHGDALAHGRPLRRAAKGGQAPLLQMRQLPHVWRRLRRGSTGGSSSKRYRGFTTSGGDNRHVSSARQLVDSLPAKGPCASSESRAHASSPRVFSLRAAGNATLSATEVRPQGEAGTPWRRSSWGKSPSRPRPEQHLLLLFGQNETAMQRSRVVLPDPLGPSRRKSSPGPTRRSTASRATTPPKRTLSLRIVTSIMGQTRASYVRAFRGADMWGRRAA
jgi:hypothetical protein